MGRETQGGQLQLPLSVQDGVRGLCEDHAQAHAEGEQVLERDRAFGGHGVVEVGVDAAQHAAVGQLGEEVVDRCVKVQGAVVDEPHDGGGGDGLGHRGDTEDVVAPQGLGVAEGPGADDIDVRTAVAGDERDAAGHVAALDMTAQDVVETDETRWGEPATRHRRAPG